MPRRILLVALGVSGASIWLQAQAALEFDVASIKRNTTNTYASGPPPNPASGQISMTNVPIQSVVLAGFPLQMMPVQVIGLPEWATSERYDLIAKFKPGATVEERQAMWRSFLHDRLKLQAHYETRERAGYHLVFARPDKRLGPQLEPSTLDCAKPPAPLDFAGEPDEKSVEAMAMTQCRVLGMITTTTQALYTGGTPMSNLVRTMSGFAGRPVVDLTALEGNYAVKLTFAPETPLRWPGAPPPVPVDNVPSLFTAVQEQLGLKLETATIQGQVLVIDHIERPSEN